MSIASSDLIAYCSLSRPQDDSSTTGGAIDVNHRPAFTQLASNGTLEVISSSAGDTTQIVSVLGRDATGSLKTSTATLNGTSAVALSPATTFERVLTCSVNATIAGTVTLRKSSAGATVGTIIAGERGFDAFFINAASAGTSLVRYEKLFWKNTHGTLTLLSSTVTLTADPSSVTQQGIAATVDDTATIANRLAVPAGISFVGISTAQSVPSGGDLVAGSAVGVWHSQSLAISNAALRTTFTSSLAGNSV